MKVWVIEPGFPLSHKIEAYFVPWAGGPGKEATDCCSLQQLLPSASSITSSGSHSGKEQIPKSGSEEGFPRASLPPRSPTRTDSIAPVLAHCRMGLSRQEGLPGLKLAAFR